MSESTFPFINTFFIASPVVERRLNVRVAPLPEDQVGLQIAGTTCAVLDLSLGGISFDVSALDQPAQRLPIDQNLPAVLMFAADSQLCDLQISILDVMPSGTARGQIRFMDDHCAATIENYVGLRVREVLYGLLD